MSMVVVRCPECVNPSRVASESLGQIVACPRCEHPFFAVEDVPVVQPRKRPSRPVANRRRPSSPQSLPHNPPPRQQASPSVSGESRAGAAIIPDPEHDPHLPPPAGLPISVLVGLALLPLAIPLFWWAAPALTGQEAALSIAVPASLAFAASTLCMGVVYTIDWSAATRIKGVLILLGLAYLSGAGLFFLKKDMINHIRGINRPNPWRSVSSTEGKYQVQMPGFAESADIQPIPNIVRMSEGKRARYLNDTEDEYIYQITTGLLDKRVTEPDAAWFETVSEQLAEAGRIVDQQAIRFLEGGYPGREWTLDVRKDCFRVVRVYVIEGRVYYLSVEGRNVSPTDEDVAAPFFQSFQIIKGNDPRWGKPKR